MTTPNTAKQDADLEKRIDEILRQFAKDDPHIRELLSRKLLRDQDGDEFFGFCGVRVYVPKESR